MKIIVAGAGEVGRHLAKMLSQVHHDITIIDSSEERLRAASEGADIITVLGKTTSINTLISAGVKNADLFISVSPAQEQDVNIVSSLLAKRLGAKRVTARINNEEYLSHENKLLFTELGIDSLFYPEKIVVAELMNLLKQTATSEFMDYSHGKLQLVAFKLNDGSPLIGKSIMDFIDNGDPASIIFRAVAISRDSQTIMPKKDTVFKQNDVVYIISTKEGIGQVMELSGKESLQIKKLMILGGGRIGEMMARQLEKTVEHIKVIELREERASYLSEVLDKTLVINGDGRNSDMLIDEDIKGYDAFVAVTSSSETNIMSCMVAKKLGVPKVIAEVENFEYIKLAEDMGLDTVVNKKLITAGRIFRFTLSNKVRSIKVLYGTDAEILEFIVNPNSKITTNKIKYLKFPEDAIIGGIIRGNKSFMANGDTQILAYDQVVVFAHPSVISKVDKFFL